MKKYISYLKKIFVFRNMNRSWKKSIIRIKHHDEFYINNLNQFFFLHQSFSRYRVYWEIYQHCRNRFIYSDLMLFINKTIFQ